MSLMTETLVQMDKFPNDPLEAIILGVCLTIMVAAGFFMYYLADQVN